DRRHPQSRPRLRRRRGVLPFAVLPSPGSRVSRRGGGSQAGTVGGPAPGSRGAGPQPGLRRHVLGHLHRLRADGHHAGLVPVSEQAAAQHGGRRLHRRDGSRLHRLGVRHATQPRMAPRRADRARRPRRPRRGGRRLRDRLDAVRRADAGSHPRAGRHLGGDRAGRRAAGRLLGRPGAALPVLGSGLRRGGTGLLVLQAPLRRGAGRLRRRAGGDGRARAHRRAVPAEPGGPGVARPLRPQRLPERL
ncbi:MAG: Cytochrome c-type biogenesis protein CcdA (DsbD analog), partial [uncultured Solirubrobacteraceae bacterium]